MHMYLKIAKKASAQRTKNAVELIQWNKFTTEITGEFELSTSVRHNLDN